jgi:riboflavin synthase
MFTGIVTDVGHVLGVEPRAEGLRHLSIGCGYDVASINIGASIACNGVCMTVVTARANGNKTIFEADAGAETLAATTVGDWIGGTRVNLERALRVGDELGGHIVSGHIDGMAVLVELEHLPEMARLMFRAPSDLLRFIARKGSVAVDGVSLTVNTVAQDLFSVLLIPHTLSVTTFGGLRVGATVNLEVDTMARYAARLLETG